MFFFKFLIYITFLGIYYLGYSNPKVAEDIKASKWQYLCQPVLGSIIFAVKITATVFMVFEYCTSTYLNSEPLVMMYAVNYTGLLTTGSIFFF